MAADPDELVSVTLPRRALIEAYANLRFAAFHLRVKGAGGPEDARAVARPLSEVNEASRHFARALGFEFDPEIVKASL